MQAQQPHHSEVEEQSSQSSNQFIIPKPAGRANPNCQVCSKANGKYKCPKCDYRTCSAYCSNQHKRLVGCDGVKVVTEFIPQKEYAEKECKQDYKFLLSMMDNVDKVRKSLTGVASSSEQMRSKLLKRNAKVLYDIELKVAPNIIERHRENISFFFLPTQEIFWVFQLIYEHPGHQNARFLTDPICDQIPLEAVLKHQFLSTEMLTKSNINTTLSHEFRILIKNKYNFKAIDGQIEEHVAKGKSKYEYIELNRKQPINKQLAHITLFEYPTLLLLHDSLIAKFSNRNWTAFLPTLN